MADDRRLFVFLRAINAGPDRITNARLIEPFVALGFDQVAAYQAAGNITFRTDNPDRADPDTLAAALTDAYGFETQVFVRRLDQVRATVRRQPFTEEDVGGTEGRVQVSFLPAAPSEETAAAVLALTPPEDRITFADREWFWLPRRDVAASRLPVARIERVLGPTTMRTLGTVTRMLAKFDDD